MSYNFCPFCGCLTNVSIFCIKTTYENFRYRADNRVNVYNRGCLNNFLEVFCTEVKPSKNKFRALVQEEVQRTILPTTREIDPEDLSMDRRPKVEDDLDIGEDLLKISQRRNIEEFEEDIRSRGSSGPPHITSELDSYIGSDHRAPTIRSETHHSSWGRKESWDAAANEVLSNPMVTESRSNISQK